MPPGVSCSSTWRERGVISYEESMGGGGREATCAVKVREFKLGVDRWPRDGYHVGYNDTLH